MNESEKLTLTLERREALLALAALKYLADNASATHVAPAVQTYNKIAEQIRTTSMERRTYRLPSPTRQQEDS